MRIGLISDTHDRLPMIRSALRRFTELGITTLIHPGDVIAPFAAKVLKAFAGDLHIVFGNNDGEREGLRRVLPQIQDGPLRLVLSGRRLLVHHFIDWCAPRDIEQAEIVITGHTHEASVTQRDGRLFVNPGECCGWVTGRATVAALDLQTNQVELIEVSE